MKIIFSIATAVSMLFACGIVIGQENESRKFKITPTCKNSKYIEDSGIFGIAKFRIESLGKNIVIDWTGHDKDGLQTDKGTTILYNCAIQNIENWVCRHEGLSSASMKLYSISEMKDSRYKITRYLSSTDSCTVVGEEMK